MTRRICVTGVLTFTGEIEVQPGQTDAEAARSVSPELMWNEFDLADNECYCSGAIDEDADGEA